MTQLNPIYALVSSRNDDEQNEGNRMKVVEKVVRVG